MTKRILSCIDLTCLFLLSFFTRIWNLVYPAKVVFDETYFGLFAAKYLSHQYYFDIHPPLGKMLFGLVAFFSGINASFRFTIYEPYQDLDFLWLRLLPSIIGALLIPLLYLLVRESGFSRRVALMVGLLALLDNALLVQSRFILMDMILLFFIVLSLYFFVLVKKSKTFSRRWYVLQIFLAISLGFSISIKWTGFGALGIVLLIFVLQNRLLAVSRKELFVGLFFILLAPIMIYCLIFALHFSLLQLPCTSSCDNGAYIHDNALNVLPSRDFIDKFSETHKSMILSGLNAETVDSRQSPWYGWPFMIRPIKYFEESFGEKISVIYFLGNPFVWWLGLLGVLTYMYLLARNNFVKLKMSLPNIFYSENIFIFFLGYLVYTLGFATIKRFMLMYHYLPALIFSIIMFSIVFNGILDMLFGGTDDKKILSKSKWSNCLYFIVLIIVAVGFIYFAPLSYGLPLSTEAYQHRMWFDIWKL